MATLPSLQEAAAPCERCHDPVERGHLPGDPLARVCLECLTDSERRDLERDLERAARVQQGLLPPEHVHTAGWEIEHRYRPLGAVSGDYCDVLSDGANTPLQVVLGDVSGKGLSASILMSHLQAVFRSLASPDLPIAELARTANRILCERSMSSAYSTLLLARLWPDGALELCNAGHCPALWVRDGEVTPLTATGVPLGLFADSEFGTVRLRLEEGDNLLLYTDGLSETTNRAGESYGDRRVEAFARRLNGGPTSRALHECLEELDAFRGETPRSDDLTVMVIRRNG